MFQSAVFHFQGQPIVHILTPVCAMIHTLFGNKPIDHRKALSFATLLVMFVLAVWAGSLYLPGWVDWGTFRRGSLLMIQVQSPYQEGVYNPPWMLDFERG